jgi:transposase InsO family protein
LTSTVKGQVYYLYLFEDIYIRKVVGYEVYEQEVGERSGNLLQRCMLREQCLNKPLVLYSDNGSPMNAQIVKAKMKELGVLPPYRRPRVSDCNPYSEALFRTLKYRLLANKKEPLSNTLIQQYRAVVASDSSRQLAPKTVGLLLGQPTLTVSDLENKITAQKKGLGVGSLPRHMISKELKSGALIVKETEDGGISNHTLNYAWNTCHKGKALAWFKQQLCDDKNKIDWFTESE